MMTEKKPVLRVWRHNPDTCPDCTMRFREQSDGVVFVDTPSLPLYKHPYSADKMNDHASYERIEEGPTDD
jgi:hypothetical protein